MTVNLSSLTLKAGASPFGNVCIYARPEKVGCWEPWIPGCKMLWRELKTVCLNVSGTRGEVCP